MHGWSVITERSKQDPDERNPEDHGFRSAAGEAAGDGQGVPPPALDPASPRSPKFTETNSRRRVAYVMPRTNPKSPRTAPTETAIAECDRRAMMFPGRGRVPLRGQEHRRGKDYENFVLTPNGSIYRTRKSTREMAREKRDSDCSQSKICSLSARTASEGPRPSIETAPCVVA